ncbi:MAG: hypothetical protein ACR2OX_06685 [Methyloligellaceae bacterium]
MDHIVSRNGVARAVPRLGSGRKAVRFAFLALAKALVLCAMVGCAAPQQVSVGEAYNIPQPHHALLQTHEKPKCDLGAPSQLPVKAKVKAEAEAKGEDSWTPYSGKPDSQAAREYKSGVQSASDNVTDPQPASENKPEAQSASDNGPDAQAAPDAADHADTYDLLSKERNCYQQAEVKARKKLHRLQSSVSNTVIALQRETTVRAPAQQ